MQSGPSNTNKSAVAFLWDESFLWGLMAYKALTKSTLPFDLVRSADIRNGVLDHYKMLFVPGGWASNKSRTLGDSGIRAVRRFVESGGSYLGFCGGAGLATQGKGGMGLLDVQRKSTGERVPSFSGRVKLNVNDHQIWEGIIQGSGVRGQESVFHAWWPSQFVVQENADIRVLAAYGDAMHDAFSSDLNVGDVETSGGWEKFEKIYGINLDPARLKGEPAVVEGQYGQGRVVLSLVHFDTPGDENGQEVLVNLWKYLSSGTGRVRGQGSEVRDNSITPAGARCNVPLQNMCSELISLGERNFLWFWRNSMLLQWRRGVRGLEYNTLDIMMREISGILADKNTEQCTQNADRTLEKIDETLTSFIGKAKKLLILERHALQKGPITYIQCDDPEIQCLRKELFGSAKSHGGMFKEVLDAVDECLFNLLNER